MTTKIVRSVSSQSTEKAASTLSRRHLLQGLLVSVGAIATTACTQKFAQVVAVSSEQNKEGQQTFSFYNPDEYQLVERLSDIIIPTTDTPGALQAGVPNLMDKLYFEWASADSQNSHRKALLNTLGELTHITQSPYLLASTEQQQEALKQLDKLAFSSQRSKLSDYRWIKQTIARCYYLTEPGATQELRYERVPGKWQACIPLEQVGRTWAK